MQDSQQIRWKIEFLLLCKFFVTNFTNDRSAFTIENQHLFYYPYRLDVCSILTKNL
jgi:hypothetical protein